MGDCRAMALIGDAKQAMSEERVATYEPMCNVEILQNVYMEYARIQYKHKFLFSPQVWGSLHLPKSLVDLQQQYTEYFSIHI